MYYRSANSAAAPNSGKRGPFFVKHVQGVGGGVGGGVGVALGLGGGAGLESEEHRRYRVKKEMTEILASRRHYPSDNTDSEEYGCNGQYTSDETDSDDFVRNPSSSPLIHTFVGAAASAAAAGEPRHHHQHHRHHQHQHQHHQHHQQHHHHHAQQQQQSRICANNNLTAVDCEEEEEEEDEEEQIMETEGGGWGGGGGGELVLRPHHHHHGGSGGGGGVVGDVVRRCRESDHERAQRQLSMLALMLAAFRRSLLTCRAPDEECNMDIGWPTNVQHVAHVTFDRYNGFLGLPVEFEVEVPRRVPSASASVFGVSAESMQCSYDLKGNSVPTILLLMQEALYGQGGMKVEGIFRINAESIHEEHARKQLNKGIVPNDIDLHCLAGLIKAWFRELPRGVLDSLTPEQVMQCHTEEQCVELVKLLPSTQAALLDWAVNLMADVAQEEQINKMNARNIAMVFAPNMTQMADPLTALMHAVQVMNFLKTLILRTLRDREDAVLDARPASSGPEAPDTDGHDNCAGGALPNGYHESEPVVEASPTVQYQEYCIVVPKKRGKGKAKGGRIVNTIDQTNERVEAW